MVLKTTLTAAGYREEVDSRVRRAGYTHNYCFDGTWKPSSFTSNADCSPSSSEPSHPSLWRVEDSRQIQAICRDADDRSTQRTRVALPGYRGYIPGKASETVFGSRFTEANNIASDQRVYVPNVPTQGDYSADGDTYEFREGKKSFNQIVRDTHLKHSMNYGEARDTAQQLGLHSGTDLFKDHAVPPVGQRSFSSLAVPGYTGVIPGFKAESHVPCSRDASETNNDRREHLQQSGVRHTIYGRAIPSYAGFIPGQTSESVFGNTFMRSHRKALHTRSYHMSRDSEAPPKQCVRL